MQVLSVIERFFLAAHEAGLGLGAAFAIGFEGRLPRELVREAWNILGDRYPIVRSVLVRRRWLEHGWSGFAWKEVYEREFGPVFVVEAQASGGVEESFAERLDRALEEHGNRPMDLERQPPIELVIVEGRGSETGLLIRIHHSALDGIALAVLSQDLVEIVDELARGLRPDRRQKAIAPRGMGQYFRAVGLRGMLAAWIAHSRVGRWNRPRVNEPLPVRWRSRRSPTLSVKRVIPSDRFAEVRAAARARAISFNDAVLAAVARAVVAYARHRNVRMRKVTLAVPMNLRAYRHLDPRESVANQGIAVEIHVSARWLDDRDELIHAIRAQTRALKATPLPLVTLARSMMLFGLPYRWVVRSMRSVLTRRSVARTTPTLTVSNVGPIWQRPDGSTAEHIGGARVLYTRHVYQCGYPMPATLAMYTYRNEVQMEMSFAEGGLARIEADELLGRIRDELFALLSVPTLDG
ncbi:MAG: hypothetical protein IPK07_32355 [Deltaproteobacteria bacterium]|nr:hypothetical protein [Deltaproteobacteria bacterium]